MTLFREFLVFTLYREVSVLQVFLKLLDLGLQVLHLTLDGRDLLVALCAHLVYLNLGVGLFDSLGFLDGGAQPLLRLGKELLPLFLSCLLKSVLAVHLLLKQFVVLAIMLLYVGSQLLGVCLFQGLDGFIVVFEILKLTLEVLATLVELLLHVLQVHLHVLSLLLVLLLELGLPLGRGLLVQVEFFLAFLPLLQVLLF